MRQSYIISMLIEQLILTILLRGTCTYVKNICMINLISENLKIMLEGHQNKCDM